MNKEMSLQGTFSPLPQQQWLSDAAMLEPGKTYRIDVQLDRALTVAQAQAAPGIISTGLAQEGLQVLNVEVAGTVLYITLSVPPSAEGPSLIFWTTILVAVLPVLITTIGPLIIIGILVNQFISSVSPLAWAILIGIGGTAALIILAQALGKKGSQRVQRYF